jgi:hypothetical protein
MSESFLSQPYFHSEEAAYAHVEARIWPNGPDAPIIEAPKAGKKKPAKATKKSGSTD